jgi:pimeloyl-ACP methyl ester carboxylesterase
MRIDLDGTVLWFDVEGPVLVPDGARMRERPTVVLVHGGPGGYDHSYFKPEFARLAAVAQVVYLDLRDHGRSTHRGPAAWSFEQCADDIAAFCDALGIERPIVVGHSMGGMIAAIHAIRHPDQPGGVALLSTMARFDLDRLTEGFRRAAGDEVAALARQDYTGDDVSEAEWDRVFAAFGPTLPSADALARRRRNPDINARGMDAMRALDIVADLSKIKAPTLIVVGELDAVTPVEAAEEIASGLSAGVGRLEIVPDAGHFTWLDQPDAFWPLLEQFVVEGR